MSTGGSGTTVYSNTYSPDISNANPANLDASYGTTNPVVYAIQAYGGFSTTQAFAKITRLPETIISQFDVTGALEVLMDVRLFNAKIGILKDSDNINVTTSTTSYYDMSMNLFKTDYFDVSAAEFVRNMNQTVTNIVDVGVFRTLYTDFANYVARYFGFASVGSTTEQGFASLFSNEADFLPNSGVFDQAAMLNLIRGTALGPDPTTGAGITQLNGNIHIGGITQLLRNAVDANPFGNRDPINGTTAADPADRANYGVTDGFFADDLFFIPNNGFSITLTLGVDQEFYATPQNNPNPSSLFTQNTDASSNTLVPGTNNVTTVTKTQTQTLTQISQTVTAPLLIRLANLTTAMDPTGLDALY